MALMTLRVAALIRRLANISGKKQDSTYLPSMI